MNKQTSNRPQFLLAFLGIILILNLAMGILSCANPGEDEPAGLHQADLSSQEDAEPVLSPEEIRELQVDELISGMSQRQQIAQHFLSHLPLKEIPQKLYAAFELGLVGGIHVYRRNFDSLRELREMVETLELLAKNGPTGVPLYFSIDQEGGRVRSIRQEGFTQFPSARVLASRQEPEFFYHQGYVLGAELRAFGINLVLGPVVDLVPFDVQNVLGDRSFGPDPQRVSQIALGLSRGLMEAGVLPVIKHFPGHGLTDEDSHLTLPIISDQGEELQKHLFPFRQILPQVPAGVMMSHLLVKEWDPDKPVSLSEYAQRELLRKELGHQGLVITDGIAMKALRDNYTIDEIVASTLGVSTDILHIDYNHDLIELTDLVEKLIQERRIDPKILEISTRRILGVKLDLGLVEVSP